MNLYYISQEEETGYDTFSAAVVAAENEDAARRINPSSSMTMACAVSVDEEGAFYTHGPEHGGWRSAAPRYWCRNIADVAVALLGTAVEGTQEGVILGSFHAG